MAEQYWLKVVGWLEGPMDSHLYYGDFVDLTNGTMGNDKDFSIRPGDKLVYYSDGGQVLFAVAKVVGDVTGPDPASGPRKRWVAPVEVEYFIPEVAKAANAQAMRLPSGYDLLQVVRIAVYARLSQEDGEYLEEQVRLRTSTKKAE